MVIELQNPPQRQNDPLANTFLLPRTLEGFSAENGMGLEFAHDFLSSKVLRFPPLIDHEKSVIKKKKPMLSLYLRFSSDFKDSRSCKDDDDIVVVTLLLLLSFLSIRTN